MKRSPFKTLLSILLSVLLTSAVILALDAVAFGIPLFGLPSAEDVTKVTIDYPERSDEVRVFTDAGNIDLALKLTGFLRVSPFGRAVFTDEPAIRIVYETKDGSSYQVSANSTWVSRNSRLRKLAEEGAFLKIAAGLFFPENTAAG